MRDSTWTCILITCSCVVDQALRFLGLYSGEMHADLIVFANLVSVFMVLVKHSLQFLCRFLELFEDNGIEWKEQKQNDGILFLWEKKKI